jgi:hypothetical protein
MFPPWSADDLFGPPLPADDPVTDSLLTSVPQSFPADVLAGAWVTSYTFSQPTRLHVDIAHITVEGPGRSGPELPAGAPEPRTEGHRVPYRNEIEAQLANRHLIGCWKTAATPATSGRCTWPCCPDQATGS